MIVFLSIGPTIAVHTRKAPGSGNKARHLSPLLSDQRSEFRVRAGRLSWVC